ncbi:coxsackievirus and adenovirus receptor homolog [Anabas testudineus]|uniref:coxsackievirus and adenovirus receptor homolog n=1 Tax=Anabas testudineus TaxID=64144 RepID=UPI000E4591C3|nr:coxsackievirus and adenovirus receptor homolog [Anabas testudineus]
MTSSKWILFFCLLTCLLYHAADEDTKIKAKPGQDVVLQCQSSRSAAITMLKYVSPDLKLEGYVFFFRENRVYENYQDPSYRGRVELKDSEMKDGDASVILKNVNINDTGTYECYVGYGDNIELINTINLKVEPGTNKDRGDKDGGKSGGHKDRNSRGHVGLAVGLSVTVLFLVLGFMFLTKLKRTRQSPNSAPADSSDGS